MKLTETERKELKKMLRDEQVEQKRAMTLDERIAEYKSKAAYKGNAYAASKYIAPNQLFVKGKSIRP